MIKREFMFPSTDGLHDIHAACWEPEGPIIAVLQLVHGMVEYINRYEDWARYMAAQGVLVIGHDHLGHGESVDKDKEHGHFPVGRGNDYLIGDIHRVRMATQRRYPQIPYFILGHSMGSFLTRQYIMLHGKNLTGAIIMGTGSQPMPLVKAGRLLCQALQLRYGWKHRSDLVESIAFGSYNKRIKPLRTPKDWLSVNEENVDKYLLDPYCSFQFTLSAYDQMFKGIEYIQKPRHIRQIPKTLPLLLIAGAEDPVGNYSKGVEAVADSYVKAGISDVMVILYDQDRHEILNENNKEQVYEDLSQWIFSHM